MSHIEIGSGAKQWWFAWLRHSRTPALVRVTINDIPLLPGQAKAVAIAVARLETDLAEKPETGDKYTDEPVAALLKLAREVRELIHCDGGS